MQVVQGPRLGEYCLCCSVDLPPVLNGFIKDQHSGNTHPRHCHCFLSTAFMAARTRIILTEDLIQMRRKQSISADGGPSQVSLRGQLTPLLSSLLHVLYWQKVLPHSPPAECRPETWSHFCF